MKKTTIYLLTAFMMFAAFPMQIHATSIISDPPTTTAARSPRAEQLTARLNEIKAIDKSTLIPCEKRELRKETRSIKKELRELNGGVYLSAGAIILIVVLLIILL